MEKTLCVVERQCKINLSVEMRNRMVDAALGMTSMEADLAFCLAAVKDDLGQNAPYTVSSEKEQIIKKSGILDYFPKNESLKDVGGAENGGYPPTQNGDIRSLFWLFSLMALQN